MQGNSDLEMAKARLFHNLSERIRDERVLDAMEHVPREMFVPPASRSSAYDDNPLPIEMGQTISQPFIIALMTSALDLSGQDRVLEIGTGSGYQAAILAELAQKVITVERYPRLIEQAGQTLQKLGYENIEIHQAGETLGWPQGAPYDGIIVTAAAPDVPQTLLDQLAPGGRLIIPVGGRLEQKLLKITRQNWGFSTSDLGGCRFVPLIGEGAWPNDG
ncbi:MAG: protein-L-isoaspartate(D-aspartate) O-methyltransferase [Dehalococcoidia bacterium]